MNDFKILIVRDEHLLIKEFEVHCTDEATVKHIINSFITTNFNEACKGYYFFIG